jgi:hypothetical protein
MRNRPDGFVVAEARNETTVDHLEDASFTLDCSIGSLIEKAAHVPLDCILMLPEQTCDLLVQLTDLLLDQLQLLECRLDTTIDVPGATNTQAWDIDNNGDVVYQWSDAKGTHGALRQQGKYYKFDDPHGVGTTYGFGINDNSQIVGSYVASGFQGFEATY